MRTLESPLRDHRQQVERCNKYCQAAQLTLKALGYELGSKDNNYSSITKTLSDSHQDSSDESASQYTPALAGNLYSRGFS
jgi:hypothetical protein